MKVYLSGHVPKNQDEWDWRKDFLDISKRMLNSYSDRIEYLYPLSPYQYFSREIAANKEKLEEYNYFRDTYFLNVCDIAVIAVDLSVGKLLGTCFELGYLSAKQKPTILINRLIGKDKDRGKFLEHQATIVVSSFEQAVEFIKTLLV
jgi:nucleoside 2-deoxyribosyltransferase